MEDGCSVLPRLCSHVRGEHRGRLFPAWEGVAGKPRRADPPPGGLGEHAVLGSCSVLSLASVAWPSCAAAGGVGLGCCLGRGWPSLEERFQPSCSYPRQRLCPCSASPLGSAAPRARCRPVPCCAHLCAPLSRALQHLCPSLHCAFSEPISHLTVCLHC